MDSHESSLATLSRRVSLPRAHREIPGRYTGPRRTTTPDRELLTRLAVDLVTAMGHGGLSRMAVREIYKLSDDQVAEAMRLIRSRFR